MKMGSGTKHSFCLVGWCVVFPGAWVRALLIMLHAAKVKRGMIDRFHVRGKAVTTPRIFDRVVYVGSPLSYVQYRHSEQLKCTGRDKRRIESAALPITHLLGRRAKFKQFEITLVLYRIDQMHFRPKHTTK